MSGFIVKSKTTKFWVRDLLYDLVVLVNFKVFKFVACSDLAFKRWAYPDRDPDVIVLIACF